MKILPFQIPKSEQATIIFQIDDDESFFDKLHQHTEIQISLISEGRGTLIIGDTVNYYNKGDIVVIGGNLPHVFKSDTKASKTSKMFTLFFAEDAFGEKFFNQEPLKELGPFFKRAIYGFKVESNKNKLTKLFHRLENTSKINQFIIFFEILKRASFADFTSLSSFIYNKKYTENEGKKMRDVIDYTMTNFEHDITLNTIADVASMTKNSFCKYFKKRTNKTYFQFLNELRIEYASDLLTNNKEFQIAEIAYASGFKNISNFNRQFKTIKHQTPSDFRYK